MGPWGSDEEQGYQVCCQSRDGDRDIGRTGIFSDDEAVVCGVSVGVGADFCGLMLLGL